MKEGTIEIMLDAYGTPFVVGACTTDGTAHSPSTYEYIRGELEECIYLDLFDQVEKEGVYRVIKIRDEYPDFVFVGEKG